MSLAASRELRVSFLQFDFCEEKRVTPFETLQLSTQRSRACESLTIAFTLTTNRFVRLHEKNRARFSGIRSR